MQNSIITSFIAKLSLLHLQNGHVMSPERKDTSKPQAGLTLKSLDNIEIRQSKMICSTFLKVLQAMMRGDHKLNGYVWDII